MFEDIKEKISGPVFTVYTAFDKNENIDYSKIESHIDFMYKNGARIFYVMPYNSRYSQLKENEILKLNQNSITYIKKYSDTIAIVSDPIHGPSSLSVEFGHSAIESGVDIFASIVREKFFSVSQICNHYDILANYLDVPLLVHEMPFLSGYDSKNMNWPIELFSELSKIEKIIAIKEDAKDIDYAIKLLEFEPRFRFIFAGRKRFFYNLRKYNLKAYLNSISMIDPTYAFDFWYLFKNGDDNTMDAFLKKFDDQFWDVLVKNYGWHRVNKSILELSGFMNRRERSPLEALPEHEIKVLKKWYDSFINNRIID